MIIFSQIVLDDMMADTESNKNWNPIVTEWFLRRRKINISLIFASQSCLKVPKTIRINAPKKYFIIYYDKGEIQQIASNLLSDINFKYFMKLHKYYTEEPYSANNI